MPWSQGADLVSPKARMGLIMKRVEAERIGRRRWVLENRITPRLEPEGDCLIWPGAHSRGYGQISLEGRAYSIPRLVMEVEIGKILNPREFVCHTCDTPACCSVEHLFVGTQTENMRYALAKGRIRGMFKKGHKVLEGQVRGEEVAISVLKERDVSKIRALNASGVGYRKLAKQFGVARGTIRAVVKMITWKHV